MISTLLSTALGGLMNWVRGGNALGFIGKKFGEDVKKKFNIIDKFLNDAVFGIWFAILAGTVYEGFIGETPTYTTHFSWSVAAILAGVMSLGRAPGWGVYIGGMINKEITGEKEIEQIDELVLKDKTDKPVLRNAIALSLRGGMWSLSLAAGLLIVKLLAYSAIAFEGILITALAGLLMGPVYWVAIEIAEKVMKKHRNQGWWLGEVLFGGVLWGTVSLAVF